jgi:hypothetical protein
MGTAAARKTPQDRNIFYPAGRFVMRRVTALCAAAGIAAASLAVISPAQAGYYVIRWDNTGVCQIWNEDLTSKPMRWPSDYKVVSKPVPTFTAAATVQEQMRQQRQCTL